MIRFATIITLITSIHFAVPHDSQAGLIIDLLNRGTDFGGTMPTNTSGAGSLDSVMQAAAAVWELAFKDIPDFTLFIDYAWAPLSGDTLGVHQLELQGGSPHREFYGLIGFDSDESSEFFLDGSLDSSSLAALIASSSEYTTYTESSSDLGGGSMNVQRSFSGATGAAVGKVDLFSVALHEIGHALGLASANTEYQDESWPDNDIDVVGSLPFAGSVIPTNNTGTSTPPTPPTASNAHIPLANNLLQPGIGSNVRRLPAAVDILANAQLSQFSNPNLDLQGVPEPSGLLLAGLVGSTGIVIRVRRRISNKTTSA